jgi:hypothetical protein
MAPIRKAAPHLCRALALALLLAAPAARAAEPPTFADRTDEDSGEADRRFGFMLDPLAMAIGVFGGEVDFVLGRHAAVAVEGALYRRDGTTATVLGAGLLVYPWGNALHGAYLEPHVAYARPLSEPFSQFDWSVDALGLGATAGWQWTWDYGFSVRFGGGVTYFLGSPRNGALDGAFALGPELVLDGSLGWVFP